MYRVSSPSQNCQHSFRSIPIKQDGTFFELQVSSTCEMHWQSEREKNFLAIYVPADVKPTKRRIFCLSNARLWFLLSFHRTWTRSFSLESSSSWLSLVLLPRTPRRPCLRRMPTTPLRTSILLDCVVVKVLVSFGANARLGDTFLVASTIMVALAGANVPVAAGKHQERHLDPLSTWMKAEWGWCKRWIAREDAIVYVWDS